MRRGVRPGALPNASDAPEAFGKAAEACPRAAVPARPGGFEV